MQSAAMSNLVSTIGQTTTPVLGNTATAVRTRDISIDVFKGLLVILMIFGHLLAFYSTKDWLVAMDVLRYHNHLVIFTGLLFAFGYSCYYAYYSRDYNRVRERMGITALKCYAAYCICGLFFLFTLSDSPLWPAVLGMITLENLPIFSEFLLSYTLYMLLGMIAFPAIRWMLESKSALVLACCLSLLSTAVVHGYFETPQFGLLLGNSSTPSFPILQYAVYFILGLTFARYRVGWKISIFIIATLASNISAAEYLYLEEEPSRFPPSFTWILAPAFLIYVYYLASRWLSGLPWISAILQGIGRNILAYLIFSNLLIFMLQQRFPDAQLSTITMIALTVLIIFAISFFIGIVRPSTEVKQRQ